MDPKLATLLALRIGAIVLGDQGKATEAAIANGLIRAYQAGLNVDAEMQEFADKLGTADEPSMQELLTRLNAATDEFLSRGPDGQLPAA